MNMSSNELTTKKVMIAVHQRNAAVAEENRVLGMDDCCTAGDVAREMWCLEVARWESVMAMELEREKAA